MCEQAVEEAERERRSGPEKLPLRKTEKRRRWLVPDGARQAVPGTLFWRAKPRQARYQ